MVHKTHRTALGDDDVIVQCDIHALGGVADGVGHLDIGCDGVGLPDG